MTSEDKDEITGAESKFFFEFSGEDLFVVLLKRLGVFPGDKVFFVGKLIGDGWEVDFEFDGFGFADAIDDHAAFGVEGEGNVDGECLKNQ